MLSNKTFFQRFWPKVAVAVTASRPQKDGDILPLLRRLRIRRGARVFDVPCGFGRHAVLLARRGYRVTGADIGREVLAEARRRSAEAGVAVDLRRLDMRKLRFHGEFDAVLNLFTSFGYFGDEGDAQVLRGFYRALRPGGWVALQMINRDFVMRHYRPRGRTKLPGGMLLRETVSMDWATSVIRTRWVVSKGRTTWRGETNLRIYSAHELARMLRAAGFARISAHSNFSGAPLTFDHQWQLLLGQKPKSGSVSP